MPDNVIESRVQASGGKGSYAAVNGLNLYYEDYGKRGAGRPLILLHGGLGTTGMFAQLLPALAQNRQALAVELQGHGHTADIDRPMSYESMADDIAALIRHLGVGSADLIGYSLGGGVAWQTAIRHPDVVGKLVAVSSPCKRDGWYPADLEGMSAMTAEVARTWVGSPMQAAYASAAPRPDDFPVLVDKLGQLLRKDYDWSKEVAALKTPVLVAVGDADGVRLTHAVELFGLLGGGKTSASWDGSGMSNSRLAILPATTHYNILFSPALAAVVISFLDA